MQMVGKWNTQAGLVLRHRWAGEENPEIATLTILNRRIGGLR